eukprot:8503569-Lingulodinium_polyedra.AAC.1
MRQHPPPSLRQKTINCGSGFTLQSGAHAAVWGPLAGLQGRRLNALDPCTSIFLATRPHP